MSIRLVGPAASGADQVPSRGDIIAMLVGYALTGTPTAPTAAPGTSTTQLATTEFVALLGALKQDEILQLEPADPIPGGTPAGTIIVRKGTP